MVWIVGCLQESGALPSRGKVDVLTRIFAGAGRGRGAAALAGALLMPLLVTGSAVAQPPPPPVPGVVEGLEQVLGKLLPPQIKGSGVVHQEFVTTDAAGRVEGDLLIVDLADSQVSVDLLYPGVVAARAPLTTMADARGAVAGVNGDFFDIGGTNAPAGPAIVTGAPLKSAVPPDRRLAPQVPGTAPDAVIGVADDGIGRLGRLALDGQVETPRGPIQLAGLNQYALPPGGVGLFTPAWGAASRAGSTCCTPNAVEVEVRGGAVSAVRHPGAGPVPGDGLVLVGREGGADVLRALRQGEPVRVDYRLFPDGGPPFQFAVGGIPVLLDGAPLAGLDDRERAPRTGAGLSPSGRRMYLVTVDGRQEDSIGATLLEFAALLRQLGIDDAVNLDGGGSSTLVLRDPGAPGTTIRNDPSDDAPRPVPNGIGVFIS